jgi:hypothetical protein
MSEERNEIEKRAQQFEALKEQLAREREERMSREAARTREMLKFMREKLKSF